MKKVSLTFLLCGLAISAGLVRAQDKPKSETDDKKVERKIPDTPIRVQVVFNDYDGDKKIASLPYTLLVDASHGATRPSSIRMGLRVPIPTGPVSDNAAVAHQYTYQDIGANIDGSAECLDDGRYKLHLNLDRSSLYSQNNEPKAPVPVIQTFRTTIELLLHDGQTIQSTVATDPVSGHVIKVDVTLNVVK